MRLAQFGLAVLSAALFAVPATAQLIAYEGFDYDAGTDLETDGVNGGTGWGTIWAKNSGNGAPDKGVVLSGGLSYTDALGNILDVSGNHAITDHNTVSNTDDADGTGSGNVQYHRHVDFSVLGDGSATTLDEYIGADNSYYVSFIGERQGATDSEAFPDVEDDSNPYSRNAHLSFTTGFGGGEDAQLGNPSNQETDTWKIRAKDTPDADSGVQFSNNQSFIVAKVTVGDNVNTTDQIDMWIDPILTSEGVAGAPDATHQVFDGGDAFNLEQTGVGMYVGSQGGDRAGGVMTFDEIRIGNTWESVTPHTVIPEPGTMVLLGLGSVALAAAYRRRK